MESYARYREGRTNSDSDEGIPYQDTGLATLGIWGDPVVAQALALLLGSSGYDTRILSGWSLKNLKVMEGVKLLLLTPMLNLRYEDWEAFLESLSEMRESTKIPVLELVAYPGETREQETPDELWYRLPWPCRTEKLERWIEATLAPLPLT